MLDVFLEVAYQQEKQAADYRAVVDNMKKLPITELYALAGGQRKLADYNSDLDWLSKYEGTPLHEEALALEQESLELEIAKEQRRLSRAEEDEAERSEREGLYRMDDAMRLRRRILDLELNKLRLQEAGGGMPAPEEMEEPLEEIAEEETAPPMDPVDDALQAGGVTPAEFEAPEEDAVEGLEAPEAEESEEEEEEEEEEEPKEEKEGPPPPQKKKEESEKKANQLLPQGNDEAARMAELHDAERQYSQAEKDYSRRDLLRSLGGAAVGGLAGAAVGRKDPGVGALVGALGGGVLGGGVGLFDRAERGARRDAYGRVERAYASAFPDEYTPEELEEIRAKFPAPAVKAAAACGVTPEQLTAMRKEAIGGALMAGGKALLPPGAPAAPAGDDMAARMTELDAAEQEWVAANKNRGMGAVAGGLGGLAVGGGAGALLGRKNPLLGAATGAMVGGLGGMFGGAGLGGRYDDPTAVARADDRFTLATVEAFPDGVDPETLQALRMKLQTPTPKEAAACGVAQEQLRAMRKQAFGAALMAGGKALLSGGKALGSAAKGAWQAGGATGATGLQQAGAAAKVLGAQLPGMVSQAGRWAARNPRAALGAGAIAGTGLLGAGVMAGRQTR